MVNLVEKLRLGTAQDPLLAPLCWGLDRHSGVELAYASPAALVEGLAEERFDAALLPPWLAWSTFGIQFIPGIGVAAQACPRQDFLYAPEDWRTLDRIYYQQEEASLLPVVHLLYAEYTQSVPEWEQVSVLDPAALSPEEGMISRNAIADTGMTPFSLVELWHEATGFPWVYSAWATRFRAPHARLRAVLTQAWQGGLAALHDDAAQDANACHRFSYRLASLESDSLRHLAGLAHKHGIAAPDGDIIFC